MCKIDELNIGNKIIEEYKVLQSCTAVQRIYNISHVTISKYLKKHGIIVINRQNEQPGLKKDIFKIIDTEEKAYWLGFLYADGSIGSSKDPNNYSIDITLKMFDLNHIEKFKAFIGTSNKVQYRSNLKAYRINVGCKEMYNDLISHGCIPNKSWLIDKIPDMNEALKIHFVRGFFDGDGCISYANKRKDDTYNVSINITGNEKMLKSIVKYFNTNINLTPKQGTEILVARWNAVESTRILKLMYDNASVYLDRKYERYQCFKKNNFAVRKSDLPKY